MPFFALETTDACTEQPIIGLDTTLSETINQAISAIIPLVTASLIPVAERLFGAISQAFKEAVCGMDDGPFRAANNQSYLSV